MKLLSKYCKSSEFITSLAWLGVLWVSYFHVTDYQSWAKCVCILTTSYILSRALFKKSRGDMMYSGFVTSELYWAIAGEVSLLIAYSNGKISMETGLIYIILIHASFNLSRGVTKTLPSASPVQILPI